MNTEQLTPWIEKLNAEVDGKKRSSIVAKMCEENSLKIGDAWKLLKEAGFDPKTSAQAGTGAGADAQAETKPALIRHKTQYQKYRCAGLILTQKLESYQVTEAQLKKLEHDPWVVIKKIDAK
jgi:hypothetical protein